MLSSSPLQEANVARTFCIELDEDALGQLCDGLEQRANSWANTARYLNGGDVDGLIEECSDAEEALQLEARYREILQDIAAQVKTQRGG